MRHANLTDQRKTHSLDRFPRNSDRIRLECLRKLFDAVQDETVRRCWPGQGRCPPPSWPLRSARPPLVPRVIAWESASCLFTRGYVTQDIADPYPLILAAQKLMDFDAIALLSFPSRSLGTRERETMIYSQVSNRGGRGVKSPADCL